MATANLPGLTAVPGQPTKEMSDVFDALQNVPRLLARLKKELQASAAGLTPDVNIEDSGKFVFDAFQAKWKPVSDKHTNLLTYLQSYESALKELFDTYKTENPALLVGVLEIKRKQLQGSCDAQSSQAEECYKRVDEIQTIIDELEIQIESQAQATGSKTQAAPRTLSKKKK